MTIDKQTLTSRAVIGRFYLTLEQDEGVRWINNISMMFDSDQESETYPWLGQVPVMREWIGGRQATGFNANGIEVRNKHFEATIEIPVSWMRRDKTGQVNIRIDDLATRANAHWASLLSTLLINGESTVCYDGQYFFDTDHSEGKSGTQSNDIQVDISAVPATHHGSVTEPSVAEMRAAILKGVRQIIGFKDDQGEPLNEAAMQFMVKVPISLMDIAQSAVSLPLVDSGDSNIIPAQPFFNISVVPNARLSWTDKFAILRTDGSAKPLIRQQETDVDLKVKAEGSEFEFDNDAHQYGIDAWRNVAYGFWQHACLVTMV